MVSSFKAFFKKEMIEGSRSYKFLILAIGILFFAVLDPVTMKLLPVILKGQFGALDFGSLIDISQRGVMASHVKNLFQLSTLVICFTLMGIIASEKTEKTLTIPVSMGGKLSAVIIGKWLLYTVYLSIIVILGMTFTYFYAGTLFKFDFANIYLVLKAGLIYSLFYSYVLSALIMLSSLFRNSFISGITVLVTTYTMSGLGFLFPKISKFLPVNILDTANKFSDLNASDFYVSLLFTFLFIFLFLFVSIRKLSSDELV